MIVAILLTAMLQLFAGSVSVSVDKKEVVSGDTVTFSITAQGQDVEFPVVKEIGGFPVLGTSQRSSISIVNGHVDKSFTKSYTFAPMRSVTIPALTVKVDGDELKTDPLEVRVTGAPKPSGGQNGEAKLGIEVDKRHVVVGEPVEMILSMRYKEGSNFAQIDLQKPEFANFWIKKVGDVERLHENGYIVEKHRYLIFPQKPGSYKLGPLTAKIAKRVRVKPPINDPFFDDDFFNGFFARLQWTRIASNSVTIDVDPLPGGVELYGTFTIRAEADRTDVEVNKPVRITVSVEGEGNIEDIKKFEPEISGAVVYADEPIVKEWLKNGVYGGTFKQNITVVADRDFMVPSFVLRYFDKREQKVVEKRTAPIFIHVVGGVKAGTKEAEKIQKSNGIEKSESTASHNATDESVSSTGMVPTWASIGLLILGMVLGGGIVYGFGYLKKRMGRKKEIDIVREIRRARSDKELFNLLLPYAKDDREIEMALKKLEENIYRGARHKIDKAWMAEIVGELEE